MDLDQEIMTKRTEIKILTEMIDNAKRDLRKLEQRKEEIHGPERAE